MNLKITIPDNGIILPIVRTHVPKNRTSTYIPRPMTNLSSEYVGSINHTSTYIPRPMTNLSSEYVGSINHHESSNSNISGNKRKATTSSDSIYMYVFNKHLMITEFQDCKHIFVTDNTYLGKTFTFNTGNVYFKLINKYSGISDLFFIPNRKQFIESYENNSNPDNIIVKILFRPCSMIAVEDDNSLAVNDVYALKMDDFNINDHPFNNIQIKPDHMRPNYKKH